MCACPWIFPDLLPCWWCQPGWLQPSLSWLDTRPCTKRTCILQHQKPLWRTPCKSSGSQCVPSEWCPGYISRAASQSWCVLEQLSYWRNQRPCIEYCSQWGQRSRWMPPVRLNCIWCCSYPPCQTRSCKGLVEWVPNGRRRDHNCRWIFCHYWIRWWALLA